MNAKQLTGSEYLEHFCDGAAPTDVRRRAARHRRLDSTAYDTFIFGAGLFVYCFINLLRTSLTDRRKERSARPFRLLSFL